MKASLNKKYFWVFLFCTLCTLYSALCTPIFAQDTQTSEPILITSDKVEYFDKKKEGEFTGNVRATQGKLLLTASRLKVNFGTQGNKIEKFVAIGNVKMVQEEISTSSDSATFFNNEQKTILTGKPHVFSKNNEFTGEKITVYLKDSRFLIEKNVKGIVFPE